MGEALVVRSQREAERVWRVLQRRRPTILTIPGEDSIRASAPRRGDAVVVWAPRQSADSLGVIAMALEYMRCSVLYVCGSGKLANVRGTFLDPIAGHEALVHAGCIIDASISEPASAIGLAGLGIPLVAASTAGASEFIDGVFLYDPWDWRTIFAAVAAARGAERPVVRVRPCSTETIASTLDGISTALRVSGPLVSVVVLTHNRRELLPLALDSIARQRYRDIEIIIVNNGGIDVADIVAGYHNATLLTLPDNILPNAALEKGYTACNGIYLSALSDDDEFFPDHYSRLVDALEQSGNAIGHSNTVTHYLSLASGKRESVAFRARSDRASDRLQILVGGTMAFHSMLFRNDVRAAIGTLRVDLAPADLEYTVRAAQHYDFVHVDAVTCEWNYAIDGSSYTFRENMYEGLKIIYDDYRTPHSSIVEHRRKLELDGFKSQGDGKMV